MQYEDTQSQLSDLRQRYEQTEQEKRSINDELEQCKVNLKLLQEQGKNVSAHTSRSISSLDQGLVWVCACPPYS